VGFDMLTAVVIFQDATCVGVESTDILGEHLASIFKAEE
jgi:hypothetical protein